MSYQQFDIKDRVKWKSNKRTGKGTIIKVFYFNRTKKPKTCAVLWDSDWPKDGYHEPRIFYVKPEELEYLDTWRLI
jgi:hypothetical protein